MSLAQHKPIKVNLENWDTSQDTVSQYPIDLIIKPTVACNFKFTFCSSTYLSDDKQDELDLRYLARFFDHYPKTNTIIINGGDPLMMSPDYYWKIIEMLDERNMHRTTLSFTTNLWLFYKNPDKWSPLFKHRRVGVGTSFQYGEGRLKHDLTPFTEQEFWDVSNLFLERIGYRPPFITVISKENEDTVLKTVELAKEMDVVAKINYLNASGPAVQFKNIVQGSENEMYVQADMYAKYIEIYEAGLMPWEYNTMQFIDKLNKNGATCPLARDCGSGIRVLQPNGAYFSCGGFGDDNRYHLSFREDMLSEAPIDPLNKQELLSMHDGCFTCPMFEICNGCKKTISDTKRLGLVKYHCDRMHEIMDRLLEITQIEHNKHPGSLTYNKDLRNADNKHVLNNMNNKQLTALAHCSV